MGSVFSLCDEVILLCHAYMAAEVDDRVYLTFGWGKFDTSTNPALPRDSPTPWIVECNDGVTKSPHIGRHRGRHGCHPTRCRLTPCDLSFRTVNIFQPERMLVYSSNDDCLEMDGGANIP